MAESERGPAHRLFIAIEIPEEIKAGLDEEAKSLTPDLEDASVRWTSPDRYHLTLVFLGQVEVQKTPEITQSLKQLGGDSPQLYVSCKGLGVFPKRGQPRVLWAGIQDETGALMRLQKRIDDSMREFKEKSDSRFHPHVTLARIKDISADQSRNLLKRIDDFPQRDFGNWQASEIVLYRSELSNLGPRHSVVQSFPLGPHKASGNSVE